MTFGYNQTTIDPRDGIAIFGPHQPLSPYNIRAGVIGTDTGITDYTGFVEQMNKPILSTQTKYKITKSLERKRPSFPGFEAAFNVRWPSNPEVKIEIN